MERKLSSAAMTSHVDLARLVKHLGSVESRQRKIDHLQDIPV